MSHKYRKMASLSKIKKSKDGRIIKGDSYSDRKPSYNFFSNAEEVDITLYRVRNTKDLFQDCTNLRKVRVVLPEGERVYDLFRRCPNLEYLDITVPDAGGVHALMTDDLGDYRWDDSFRKLKEVHLSVRSVTTYEERLTPRSKELRRFECQTASGDVWRGFCIKKSENTAIIILLRNNTKVLVANEWIMDMKFIHNGPNRTTATDIGKYRFDKYPELRAMITNRFNQSGPVEFGDIRHMSENGGFDMHTEFYHDMWKGYVIPGIGEGYDYERDNAV